MSMCSAYRGAVETIETNVQSVTHWVNSRLTTEDMNTDDPPVPTVEQA